MEEQEIQGQMFGTLLGVMGYEVDVDEEVITVMNPETGKFVRLAQSAFLLNNEISHHIQYIRENLED